MDSFGGQTRTSYDAAGRPSREMLWITPAPDTIIGETFDFDYFDLNALDNVRLDRLKEVRASGTVPPSTGPTGQALRTTQEYSAAGQLLERVYHDPRAAGAPVVERSDYKYDAAGRVKSVHRENSAVPVAGYRRVDEYVYDTRDQVVETRIYDPNGGTFKPVFVDAAGNPAYADEAAAQSKTLDDRAPSSVRWVWNGKGEEERLVVMNEYDGEGNLVFQYENPGDGRDWVRAWEYDYDHRNRLTRVIAGLMDRSTTRGVGLQFTWSELVVYATDAEDRVFQRSMYHPAKWVEVNEYGQRTPQEPGGSSQLYVRDGTALYADIDDQGQPQRWYVRGGPDQSLLGRVDLDGNRYFYATDKQGTVLSAYRDNGSTLSLVKVVAYDRTSVVTRRPENPASAGWRDRIEYAGLEYDATTRMTSDTSRWFDPQTGRYLGQTGQGIGSNPYSVAGNNAPNEVPQPRSSAPQPNDDRNWFEQFGDWVGRQADAAIAATKGTAFEIVAGVYAGLAKGLARMPAEMINMAQDTANTAVTAWDLLPVVGRSDPRLYKLHSQMNQQYDLGVKSGNGAEVWGRTVLGAGTVGLSEVAIAGYEWGFNADDVEGAQKFGAALAGPLMFLATMGVARGLGGVARSAGSVTRTVGTAGRSSSALARYVRAAPGVLREVGGMVADTLLPGVRQGLGLGRMAAQPAVKFGVHGVLGKVGPKGLYEGAKNLANRLGFEACFAAGMPIRTPNGWKLVEHIVRGDQVLSRDEFDPFGPVLAREVQEVHVRNALIWHLQVLDRIIRTTAEHPFEVEGRGWTPVNRIEVGARLWTEACGWVTVEAVEDTGVWETVYNFRVAEFHTYFVGCDEWGFSVWAHNQSCSGAAGRDGKSLLKDGFSEVSLPMNTKAVRRRAGVATGGEELPALGADWLSVGGVSRVPKQVADKLRGQQFKNWEHFKEEFWKAVSADPELVKAFTKPRDLSAIKQGLAPYAQAKDQLGRRAKMEIDHQEPLRITGERGMYDLDNLFVAPPRVNQLFESF